MIKKIFISIGLIVLILIIAAAYYYFIYQNPVENQNSEEQTSQEEEQTSEGEVLDNQELTNIIIDGIFQKIENNLIYIQVDGEEKTVKLTEGTIFSEMTFSAEMEVLNETNINLTDLVEGNDISISAIYNQTQPEDKTAFSVKRIIGGM